MPLIRLARDKRGLDTLYLLHHRPDPERRGEPRLRVLYFCAAPQGLAFGRHCLDVDTQRALERRYPDIAFDWPALLREVEQRRLPPPIEPQARRPRPPAKAERRAPSSEVAADRSDRMGGKRKKRRSGGGPAGPAPGGESESNAAGPSATSIIE